MQQAVINQVMTVCYNKTEPHEVSKQLEYKSEALKLRLAHSCMKWLEVFLLPLDRVLVHCRSLPRNLSGLPNNCQYSFIHLGREEAL